ncbi:MAG: Rossmann-like and DUF2520 domain-containing protein [Bacteroidota bacterium]
MEDAAVGIVIVGSGRVGSALANELMNAGERVIAVISRSPDDARARLRHHVPLVRDMVDVRGDVGMLIIAVPDDAIETVARQMATRLPDPQRICAVHTSGLKTSAALTPFAKLGADVLSFHPVVSFAPAPVAASQIGGCTVTLEGTERGVGAGRRLARTLGAFPMEVTVDQKRIIHAAAVIAANYTVALAATAGRLLNEANFEALDAKRLLDPLMRSVISNLEATTVTNALTGPIVRGDLDVIRRHLELLADLEPNVARLYRSLGRATVDLAHSGGRIDDVTQKRMLDILGEGIERT